MKFRATFTNVQIIAERLSKNNDRFSFRVRSTGRPLQINLTLSRFRSRKPF